MVRNAHILVAPVVGLAGQMMVLAGLAWATGLGIAGWMTGLAYGLVVCLALAVALGAQRGGLGPADRVTLVRACLVGGVAALTVRSWVEPVPAALVVAIATVALVLDAVDGRVARRTGTQSPLGARFDMEVDAFLILVLSVLVARMFGPWVLAIGAMRYALWLAERLLPWLRRPVPPRLWRKVVAATQAIVLTAVASGLFPTALSIAAVAVALALLVESFGRDVIGLWRGRHA